MRNKLKRNRSWEMVRELMPDELKAEIAINGTALRNGVKAVNPELLFSPAQAMDVVTALYFVLMR
jgi:hypothetical protein